MTRIIADERKRSSAASDQRAFLMRWRWRMPLFLTGILVVAAILAAFRFEPARISYRANMAWRAIVAAVPIPAVLANMLPAAPTVRAPVQAQPASKPELKPDVGRSLERPGERKAR